MAEYVIINESSGQEEPVRKALDKLGLNPDSVKWVNIMPTPTYGNTPTPDQIKAELPRLKTELAGAKYVLCVGTVAKFAITGSKEGVTKVQGQLLTPRKDLEETTKDLTIMAVVSPAYIMRNNSPQQQAMFLSVMGAFVAQGRPGRPETVIILGSELGVWEKFWSEMATQKRAALDIEATPVPWWDPSFRLISAAISFDGHTAYAIDLREYWKPFVKAMNQSYDDGLKFVMHNGKYDRQALLSKGIKSHLIFDTMTAQYLIDPDQRKGLEYLSGIYLGLAPYKNVDYKNILDEDRDKILTMNGIDAIRTYRLYDEILKPKVIADERVNRLFQFLMMPAVNALLELELKGIPIDTGRLADLTERYQERHDEQIALMRRMIGNDKFNPNSHAQVSKLFFTELGLPVVIRSEKTGNPSFNEETRLKLMGFHPLVETFHKWVTMEQRLSTFLKPWAEMEQGGKLHTSYKPSHVVTGRLSSEKPNFQQVPRDPEFRQVFGGVPGWKLVELDYSQIELRIAAWLSGEDTMLLAYKNDEDLHTLTAELILGDPKARQVGKVLNFGLLYGAGAAKLKEIAFNDYGVTLTLDQAERFHAQFFDTYSKLSNWHAATKAKARRDKFIDSPIGRRRYFQHVGGSDRVRASHDERAALNHPVQSMASDLMLYSLTKLHRELDPANARVVATIHDSVLLLVRNESVEEVVEHAKRIMEVEVVADMEAKFGVKIEVPLKVDYSVGDYWKE